MAISMDAIEREANKLRDELKELPEKEQGALLFVISSVQEEAYRLAQLEKDALELPDNPGLPNPLQARLDSLLRRLNGTIAAASGMVQSLSDKGAGLLAQIWQFFSDLLMSALRSIAKKLHIQSWSVGITGGFPAGISGTITVTFGP